MTRRQRLSAAVVAAGLATTGLFAGAPPTPDRTVSSPASASVPAAASSARQQEYAAAARAYHVPQSVLLAVSYLESRWDSNGGRPSVSAGYGPMHLVDGAMVAEAGAGDAGGAARGNPARPTPATAHQASSTAAVTRLPAPERTLQTAASLTGLGEAALRADPAANIRGGAALLASEQRSLHAPLSTDPAAWYGAVARYSGDQDAAGAAWFADQVFDTVKSGAARTTDDGSQVALAADPAVRPQTTQLASMGLHADSTSNPVECPRQLGCEWIPAPYQLLGDGNDPSNYGNHDLASRPADGLKIDYIVIHDTEASYDETINLVKDPNYVSWNYTIRSSDGHVAQHVPNEDVAWHDGNWYSNTHSIGIEHEGYLAQGGTWYTEAMYRSSAQLVGYLTDRYHIPVDRAHILGHDAVPGPTTASIPGMHVDPGPYWDWDHYFQLLGHPLKPSAGPGSDLVTIRPDYATNDVPYTGCDSSNPSAPCPAHGGSSVLLRTAPSADAPLVTDIGKDGSNGHATMDVSDMSAHASTGETFAVAARKGDWTGIWYLGQLAWFYNPAAHPTAVGARGAYITPRPGLSQVNVYGQALPEASAYPAGVTPVAQTPVVYTIPAGQRYSVGEVVGSDYYYAPYFDVASHDVVRGRTTYYEIQLGQRAYYVNTSDVVLHGSVGG